MFLQDIPPDVLNAERSPRQGGGGRQTRVLWSSDEESEARRQPSEKVPSAVSGVSRGTARRDGKADTRQLWGGEYRPGTLVRHPEWGLGVVQKQEGEGESLKLTIIFRDVGRKVVAAKYAKLEKVSS
jgi:hypothetical protein